MKQSEILRLKRDLEIARTERDRAALLLEAILDTMVVVTPVPDTLDDLNRTVLEAHNFLQQLKVKRA